MRTEASAWRRPVATPTQAPAGEPRRMRTPSAARVALQIYGFVKVMRRRFVTTFSGVLRGGRDTGRLGSGSLCAADGILLRDVFFRMLRGGLHRRDDALHDEPRLGAIQTERVDVKRLDLTVQALTGLQETDTGVAVFRS